MPSAPSIVSQTLRKDSGKGDQTKDSAAAKWFDSLKWDAQPEAGFIITADRARGTYSWMQYNGSIRVLGKNKIILRLGSENAEIDFPENFPISEFEESLRTQRLQRIHHKPDQELNITFVDPEEDEDSP